MTEDEYLQLIYIIHITIIYNQFWKKKSDQLQSNETIPCEALSHDN